MRKVALVLIVVMAVLAAGALVALRLLLAPERVRATIESRASAALGQPVTVGSASARLFPAVGLELRDIAIGGTPTRLESVVLETGLRPLFSRRVEDAQITVDGGRVEVPWVLRLVASIASAPAAPTDAGGGLAIVSVRTIELRDVRLTAGRHELSIDADALFQEDRLEVSRLDGSGGAGTFSASGVLSSVTRATGRFEIDAETIDLDALLAFAGAATPAGAARAGAPVAAAGGSTFAIEAVVKGRAGRLAALEFTDLSTALAATTAGVRLEPLAFRAFGGAFRGRAIVDTRPAVPRIAITGEAAGLDAAAIARFAGAENAISGRASGTVEVSCACVEAETWLSRMAGRGRFEVVDGVIPGLHVVRTAVLAFGHPESDAPARGGERFSRIAASYAIGNGTVSTRDLSFASPDFDMRGVGTISSVNGALAFEATVVLSRELSRQAGRDLYRYAREGERIVLPATISGTLESPRVFIDVREALQRALKNELENRARSLLDRLLKKKPDG